MKKILSLVLATLVYAVVAAQVPGKISLIVQNDKSISFEDATAALLKSSGKQLVKSTLADENGQVLFENIAPGTYRIKISAAGFEDKMTDSIVITETHNNVQLPVVAMLPKQTSSLKEVTVTAKKPVIQRMNDRIIVSVDNSLVNAGTSAFEVLERSPGVTIDPNDNIA
ncbi:MAG: carboxypeptidase regulatory-like domain-containing protein [Rhizobacter sp.]|nr:carboxypeptidase regulatory-like domain-containing protein [Ferruginibacter sp.]